MRVALTLAVLLAASTTMAATVDVAVAPADVDEPPPPDAFVPAPDRRLAAPRAPDRSVWGRVTVQEPAAAGERRVVALDVATVGAGHVLVIDARGQHQAPLHADDTRQIARAFPAIEVVLDAQGGATAWVRVDDPPPFSAEVTVRTPSAFAGTVGRRSLVLGGALGFATLILLYNLLMFAVRREREFGAYTLYLAPCGMLTVVMTGVGVEVGLSPPVALAAMQPLGSLIGAAAIHFVRVFLETPKSAPRLDPWLRWSAIGALVQAGLWLVLPAGPAFLSSLLITTVGIGLLLFVIVRGVWRDPRGTVFFGLAWGTLLVLVVVGMAAQAGWAPRNVVTDNAVLIGQSLEYALLALAVAERVNRIKEERLHKALEVARLSTTFERYVPKAFVAELERPSIVDVARGDQVHKEMTIFFSDVRGFTSLSEGMTAAEVFALINDYLGVMTPDIEREGGFVDKYIGDAIMALFSGRTGDGHHADAAVRAAIENQRSLWRFNAEARDRPAIALGVGLHSGPLVLGMVGSEERLNATVLGDAVNLASRVEGMTKAYGAQILITAATRALLQGSYAMRAIDRVRVKGKTEPVEVFEIFEGTPAEVEKASTREAFESALAAFQAGELAKAKAAFLAVAEQVPGDVAVQLYLDRCEHYLAEGLPAGWDGVVTLTTK